MSRQKYFNRTQQEALQEAGMDARISARKHGCLLGG
jgi:hypothetical protein